jgi:hypothetical protein
MIFLHIMWPVFAMVALIFVVWSTLVVRRMRHIKATPPTRESFASGAAASRYFEPVETPAHNLANLFEMPVLFFAIVPLLMWTQQAGVAQVCLAWIYVALRAIHSAIHLGRNDIRQRFRVYLASVAVLAAMWIGFFYDFAAAAVAYNHAIGALAQP